MATVTGGAAHWDQVYRSRPVDSLSWFQHEPAVSLRLIADAAGPAGAVVDVGGGASQLAERLLDAGWTDVTVLDVSGAALDVVRERVGDGSLELVVADVLGWQPARRYDVWHDRAVLHFLVDPRQQREYADVAARALRPGGAAIVGTFAVDGPTMCSGLPTARYDADSLAELFGPAFVLVHSEQETHVTPAGATQRFTWAVLRRT